MRQQQSHNHRSHNHQLTMKSHTSSSRMQHCAIFALVMLIGAFLSVVEAKVEIEPNPNGEIGIMSSESKYFNCKSIRTDGRQAQQEMLSWIGPNGREIVNDQANRIYTVNKKGQVKLELKNPQKEDSGVYKCIARSKTGQELHSSVFKLHVYHPTTVSGQQNYVKAEGTRSFTMDCITTHDNDVQVDFTWNYGQFDLSADPKYRIDLIREKAPRDEVRSISRLTIPMLSKEHDGKYTCLVDTSNKFLSDEKELKVSLHVQYRPRFDEKTPKYIWISEEAVQAGGPLAVNISCIVFADPVAKINWLGYNNQPVQTQQRTQPGQNVRTVVTEAENMSSLTLHYRSIDELRNPKMSRQHKYTCTASNSQGDARNTFEIKVGRIPDSPHIVHIEYKEGSIVLHLNESQVEPPVDIYRLETADQAHLFNRSTSFRENNTYVLDLPLRKGEHRVSLFAHNPVGWSENPHSSYYLTVVSGAPALTPPTTAWIAVLVLLTLGQLFAMEGRGLARFFMGSLIQF